MCSLKAFKMINYVCIHIFKKVPKTCDIVHIFHNRGQTAVFAS